MTAIKDGVREFLSHCRFERNLTDKTLQAYQIDLEQFQEHLAEYKVQALVDADKVVIRNFIRKLSETAKPKTTKRKIATLKSFFRFLEIEELIEYSPFHKMKLQLDREVRIPDVLTFAEVQRLFRTLYRNKQENHRYTRLSYKSLLRDIAILEVLFFSGMRVSELCNLTRRALDLESRLIKVYGKGRRERLIPISDMKVVQAIQEYMEAFRVEVNSQDYLFLNRGGTQISDQSVRAMVSKQAQAAGIDRHVTPHMFRHTIATLLLENGVDLLYIQALLGHSNVNTTQLYAKVSQDGQRRMLLQKHPRQLLKTDW